MNIFFDFCKNVLFHHKNNLIHDPFNIHNFHQKKSWPDLYFHDLKIKLKYFTIWAHIVLKRKHLNFKCLKENYILQFISWYIYI
jgi:hypothetical protein